MSSSIVLHHKFWQRLTEHGLTNSARPWQDSMRDTHLFFSQRWNDSYVLPCSSFLYDGWESNLILFVFQIIYQLWHISGLKTNLLLCNFWKESGITALCNYYWKTSINSCILLIYNILYVLLFLICFFYSIICLMDCIS